ncbi:MAG: hypothetical protein LBT66_09110 [Methanobrevibacter sp.]|jgi:predicted nuclease with TOPRIM domain|nr:hypothetical protein [Candidatus Methanovirga meridionalis]
MNSEDLILSKLDELKDDYKELNKRFDKIENNHLEHIYNDLEYLRVESAKHTVRFDSIDNQFKGVDKQFESVDKQFEGLDKQFNNIDKHLDTFKWMFGSIIIIFVVLLGFVLNSSFGGLIHT